jgi:hypothetical protein
MANKPKELAAEEIARVNPYLIWHGCGRALSDPAVGAFEQTEFFLEQDKPTQNKLMAVRLEAEANVNRAIADGFSKMAKALKGDG